MWSHTHTTIALQINDKTCVIFLLWTVGMLHIYVYVYCFYAYDIACQNFTHIIKVITKLPNSEQSYKGKVQTHNYINRQNQSTTGKL